MSAYSPDLLPEVGSCNEVMFSIGCPWGNPCSIGSSTSSRLRTFRFRLGSHAGHGSMPAAREPGLIPARTARSLAGSTRVPNALSTRHHGAAPSARVVSRRSSCPSGGHESPPATPALDRRAPAPGGRSAVDHLLDRLRACHGRLPPQHCGRRSQRISGHVPERQQDSRPDLMVCEILRMGGKMTPFPLRHLPVDGPRGSLVEDSELALAKALRPILARVTHPEDARDPLFRDWIAREARGLALS